MADKYLDDREAGLIYTSPTGLEFAPHYARTSRERARNHKKFDFVNIPGAKVQDLGISSDSFTLRMWFSGSEHHIQAQSFLAALSERGYAKLALPLDSVDYRLVLPVNIKEEIDFVDSMNVTTFEVEFLESIGRYIDPEFGGADGTPVTFASKLGNFIEATKQGFAEGLNTLGDKIAGTALIKDINSKVKTNG